MFLKFSGCTWLMQVAHSCSWYLVSMLETTIFTERQIIGIVSGHRLTWACKWRGWWWRAGRGPHRGRQWWSLPLHLIGQLDRSASKAWLHHPPVCLGCRRDAEETEIERKEERKKQTNLYTVKRLDICNMGKLKRWLIWWLKDWVSHCQLSLYFLHCWFI